MTMLRSILSTSVALSLLLGVAPAFAQKDPEAKARRLHEEGLWHYKNGRYDEAIADFLEAHTISEIPAIFYNVAQAYRLKGDCPEAVKYYRRYLEEVPDGQAVAKAKEHLEALIPCEAQEDQPPADPKQSTAAVTPPPPDPPGLHKDTGEDRGGGGGGALRLAAYGSLGLGAVLLGAGGYFAYQADKADTRVTNLWKNGGTWNDHFRSIEAYGRRSDRFAKLSVGAGGLAVVVGAVLFFTSGGDNGGPEIGVSADPDGAKAWAAWSL